MKTIYSLLSIFFLIVWNISFSQTWNGSVNSDWNTAANWTPAAVPGSGNNVTLSNASLANQPVLAGNVNIAALTMSAGILNLNGFTLNCSGNVSFTGDSLLNGKIVANNFTHMLNMHMGGKVVLDKTGAGNSFWEGGNKMYGDSLIVTWRWGTLHLQNSASSPDSIFGNFKIQLADDYSVGFSGGSLLYVKRNLILDNVGNGTFSWLNANNNTVVGGNLVAQNFSSLTPNLILGNITTHGIDIDGPFFVHTASIDNCSFNGNFTMVADSNAAINIHNSSFAGADNLFQAGNLDVQGNKFGKTGAGTTILRGAHNLTSGVLMRSGNNKSFGDVQWETYAAYPGGITIQHTFYGADTCLGSLSFILKGNAALTTNGNGHSYVLGNLLLDGQGAMKWIEFTGGTGVSFTVHGSLVAQNFTGSPLAGAPPSNVFFRNVTIEDKDASGTFYCYTGDINNSRFNGDLKLIADSSQIYNLSNSLFLGANNTFQGGSLDIHDCQFGQTGTGATILRAAHNLGYNVFMRDGSNTFLNNAQWETYAVNPGGVTIQQTFYGADSCLGNMNYILKGNAALTTNGGGHSYVKGNVIIDGQGARKWVQFTGGADISFDVDGNFTVKNFTPFSEPGVGTTNAHLRNLYVKGNGPIGTLYCYTGDINNSRFNGNFQLIADSSQLYSLSNSFFLGADNLFQGGNLEVQNSQFGKAGVGTTVLRAAHNLGYNVLMRDGNNKFLNNAQWETYAVNPGGVTIQQTFYGADSCLGNMNYILKGNAALTTNGSGHSHVKGNVIVDGQGARKWVQFTGGADVSFNVDGNFTVNNFTPFSEPGVGTTNAHLRNLYVKGNGPIGTLYCYTGDINNSSFNGNFHLVADSSQSYSLSNSLFLGADNLFQGGNLEVRNSQFGKTSGGTTILRAAPNVASGVYMRDGNNKFLGDVEWVAVAPPAGGILVQQTFHGPDTCLGHLAVNLSGPASANLGGNNLYLGKGLSLQNNGNGTIVHDNGTSAIYFIGTDTAAYSHGGSGSAPSLRNIVMDRKGGLRLQSPLTCPGLTLTRGVVLTSAANPLQIPNQASVVGGGDSSYVDGPMTKTGNAAFTFPLGRNNKYAPLAITAPSLATDAFTAQYINHLAHTDAYDSTKHDLTLNHLSRKEYWVLSRTSGSSGAKVTLAWKTSRSGTVNAMSDLRVARWNGTTWKDEGNGGTTGTNDEGTIQTLNVVTSFSPFTLASLSLNNPLPVRFISFKAQLAGDRTVSLDWQTGDEVNNDHFEVERSTDGVSWIRLLNVSPQLSHRYVYTDAFPVVGVNYYRIKQVDIDGQYYYTEVRLVQLRKETELFVWPNPVSDQLNIRLPFAKGSFEMMDAAGRIVESGTIINYTTTLPTISLRPGIYVLKVKYNNEIHVEKFMKQ